MNMCLFSDSSDLALESIRLNKQVPSKTVQCCCKIALTQLFHHDYAPPTSPKPWRNQLCLKRITIFFPLLLKHNSSQTSTAENIKLI